MIKLQKKSQDQMKRLVRVIIELVQSVRCKKSELNFSFNCLKAFSQFYLGVLGFFWLVGFSLLHFSPFRKKI